MFDHLAAALAARSRRQLEHRRRAAVLVPVIDDGGPLRLLLTRRTEDTPTHKGQVAFPGGGMSADDADIVEAALREAEEEVGLDRSAVEVLGLLDDFPTINWQSVVTPVVARVRSTSQLKADPREVARIFEVPFDALRVPERWDVKLVQRQGLEWPVYFFPWDGEMLWGLSAYITLALMANTPEGSPHVMPEFPLTRPPFLAGD